jgi:hypothetical protein
VTTEDAGKGPFPTPLLRWINLVLTGGGAMIFGATLVYLSVAEEDFNQRTRNYAIDRVVSGVENKLQNSAGSETANRISELAGRISPELREQSELLRLSMNEGLGELTFNILAAACKLDCERREAAGDAVERFFETGMARYGAARDRIQRLVVVEYDEVMSELRADLRIFAMVNFLVLVFAFLLSVFRGRAAGHLLPVALALTGTTVLMSIWYLFGQDWIMAIMFNDYWGWSYAIVMALLASLLVDIAANRARVTTRILNAFGGGFSPC